MYVHIFISTGQTVVVERDAVVKLVILYRDIIHSHQHLSSSIPPRVLDLNMTDATLLDMSGISAPSNKNMF